MPIINGVEVQDYVSDTLNGTAGLVMADFKYNPTAIDAYSDFASPKHKTT